MATPLPEPSSLSSQVAAAFRDSFGEAEEGVFFAPGRLNLIGAHLDYNGGDVLPLAVDLGVYAALRLRGDGRIRLRSLDQELAVEVEVSELGAERDPAHGWASYPLGVWRHLAERVGASGGVDMLFGGDLPMASGMSSSAAIETVTAFALDALLESGLGEVELARLCHQAEVEYVRVQCGIMDQFASALGQAGQALLLHCGDGSFEHVKIHGSGFEVLVMDTRKSRRLAGSSFNQRVAECREAHELLRREVRDLPWLAAYSEADLDRAGAALNGAPRLRATHVVEEMQRVQLAVEALRGGDIATFGGCLNESNRSTRDLYEVSCDELDHITAVASAHPDVFGARLTGAGFGGCAIALIRPGACEAVAAVVRQSYQARFDIEPGFMVLHAGGGPRRIY